MNVKVNIPKLKRVANEVFNCVGWFSFIDIAFCAVCHFFRCTSYRRIKWDLGEQQRKMIITKK